MLLQFSCKVITTFVYRANTSSKYSNDGYPYDAIVDNRDCLKRADTA